MNSQKIRTMLFAVCVTLAAAVLASAQIPVAKLQDANTIGIFRQQSNGYTVWYVDSAEQHQFESSDLVYWFGLNGDQPIMGDWQETGHLQTGIFRNGYWYVDYNDNHMWDSGDQVSILDCRATSQLWATGITPASYESAFTALAQMASVIGT